VVKLFVIGLEKFYTIMCILRMVISCQNDKKWVAKYVYVMVQTRNDMKELTW